MRRSKVLILIICTSLAILFLCKFHFTYKTINAAERYVSVRYHDFLDEATLETVPYHGFLNKSIPKTVEQHFPLYQNKSNLTHIKYILLWTRYDYAPFYYFKIGQQSFIENNCSARNCFITTDRQYFGGDLTKFDAIAFNGRNMDEKDLPNERSSHQKYIFFNLESADNYPVCNETFDDFFNWTATYKLNSDIPFPYIAVKDYKGDIIGPKSNMHWYQHFNLANEDVSIVPWNKTKAAAWFVSNCKSRSGRNNLVKHLQEALERYNLTVDIYGHCGPLKCPRNESEACYSMLARDYFFYMSLENSFAEDYVTEKLLIPLQHNTVPIVYGGAHYSRFLPPGSYIDSRKMTIQKLADTIHQLMHDPKMYSRFFRWKTRVTYTDPSLVENVCAVCEAMNNDAIVKTVTIYDEFRKWWNPLYKSRCRRKQPSH